VQRAFALHHLCAGSPMNQRKKFAAGNIELHCAMNVIVENQVAEGDGSPVRR
jgi:hypothetical protein